MDEIDCFYQDLGRVLLNTAWTVGGGFLVGWFSLAIAIQSAFDSSLSSPIYISEWAKMPGVTFMPFVMVGLVFAFFVILIVNGWLKQKWLARLVLSLALLQLLYVASVAIFIRERIDGGEFLVWLTMNATCLYVAWLLIRKTVERRRTLHAANLVIFLLLGSFAFPSF